MRDKAHKREYDKTYREKHREEIAARMKQYNAINREKLTENHKNYVETHKEEIREYNRRRWKERSEEQKEQKKKYLEEHRDEILARSREYEKSARRAEWARGTIRSHKCNGYTVNLTVAQIHEIASHTTHCRYCGGVLDYSKKGARGPKVNSPTLDRIDNDSFLDLTNVQIICNRCNISKVDRSHSEFITYCENLLKLNRVVVPA